MDVSVEPPDVAPASNPSNIGPVRRVQLRDTWDVVAEAIDT